MAATVFGAAGLALVAPLLGIFGASHEESWDDTKFNITQQKAPVMLKKEEEKTNKDETKEEKAPEKAPKKEAPKEDPAQKKKLENAFINMPAHLQNMKLASGGGSASTFMVNSSEMYLGNMARFPQQTATGAQSGQTTLMLETTGVGQISTPAFKSDQRIPGQFTIPGGSAAFPDGREFRIKSIGNVKVQGTATIRWSDATSGVLEIQQGFQRSDAGPNVAFRTGDVVRMDIYEEPTASVESAMPLERYKPSKDERESHVNDIVANMEDIEKEHKKNLPGLVRNRMKKQYQESLESSYGAKDSYQMQPNMEHADISCKQAVRMIRDGFPVNNASFSWQNRSAVKNNGANFYPRVSKPTRLYNRGEQSVRAGRLNAHPVTEMGVQQRSQLQRYAGNYGPGSTEFSRLTSGADHVSKTRSNYVLDHRRNEMPGMVNETVSALRPDARSMRNGAGKRVNVTSAARARGDKVQLHRMPNTDNQIVRLNVRDGQMSDRSLDRRSELPITPGTTVMPQSIATQDFGRRKENNAYAGRLYGRQKNVVRLRRGLTQIPGVMVNRLNNDGQVVNTHALQSAHSAHFKDRKDIGDNDLEGVRGSILRNAASARRDLRPDAHRSHGSSQRGGQIRRDEFVRRDTGRPQNDQVETLHGVTGKVKVHLSRNEAWASKGAEARPSSMVDFGGDKKGKQGGRVAANNAFEYRERTPNQQSDMPEQRTATESQYVSHFVRDSSGPIADKAQLRRSAALTTDVPTDMDTYPRGNYSGGQRTHDQTRVVGIQSAGNPIIPDTMASLGAGASNGNRVLSRQERTRIGVAKNTLTREDVADVEGQLRFVKATEIRENLELGAEGIPMGYVPSTDDSTHPGLYRNNLVLNHNDNDESALPRRDPHMEAVPAGPTAPQGIIMENENLATQNLIHGLSVTPNSSMTLPPFVRPSQPRESQAARSLEHTFAGEAREE